MKYAASGWRKLFSDPMMLRVDFQQEKRKINNQQFQLELEKKNLIELLIVDFSC